MPYADIPKLFFKRAYFLTPSGGSTKAYRLLTQAMERRGRAGIATFVMRGKEYLVAIVAEGGLLRAETLRFADEIRSPEDIGLPEKPRVPRKSVREFEQAIQKFSADTLRREEMEDEESQRLPDLIHTREREDKDVVGPRKTKQPKVVDLLEVLQQALRKSGGRRDSSQDLESLSRSELYKRAREMEIPGRSSMKKDELVAAIRAS